MTSAAELAQQLIASFRDDPTDAPARSDVRRAPAPIGPVRTLEATAPAGPAAARPLDLLQTLTSRRSVRFFGDGSLPGADLLDTVARGLQADEEAWPEHSRLHPLAVKALAFRIEGLPPAIHDLDPARRTAVPVAPMPVGADLAALTLQSEFCDAAVVLTIEADLQAATRSGGHGYRVLMGRASAAAYTMWLDGVSRGWVGSVFAGLLPASVRGPLVCDGASRHQLFALALGRPPAPSHVSSPAGDEHTSSHREEVPQ